MAAHSPHKRGSRRNRNRTLEARPSADIAPGSSLFSPPLIPSRPGALLVLCALLLLLMIWAFFPVISNQFVNLDDDAYVAQNFQVQRGLTWDGIAWAFGRLHGGHTYWHPLTWLSHMLDCQLFALNPAGHHFVNLLLHTLNTALVFLVFRQLTGAPGRCLFLAALFALHPLQVDTVAWVAERKNLLGALFWLLTTWAYACYAQGKSEVRSPKSGSTGRPTSNEWPLANRKTRPSSLATNQVSQVTRSSSPFSGHGSRCYVLALVLFALGLMCKPVLVTLPFVLLLLDHWPLQRSQLQASKAAASAAGRLVWEKTPFFMLAAISSLITVTAHRGLGMLDDAAASVPLEFRLENALVSYARYIGKTVWPSNLAVFYPMPNAWPVWIVLLCGLLLVTITGLATRSARNRPYLFVGWFWFLGVLVPFIGLVQAGQQAMADRFAYVPLIGLFMLLIWGAHELLNRWRYRAIALSLAGFAVVLLCAAVTRHQTGYWKDGETLFRHAAAVSGNNALLLNGLGVALSQGGEYDQAIALFRQALALKPNFANTHYNLGTALCSTTRFDEAVSEFQEAIRLQPNSADAHSGLGVALCSIGRLHDAIPEYEQAIQLDPNSPDAHSNLGGALDRIGQLDEAIGHYQQALRLKPAYAEASNNLGAAFARKGCLDEAIGQFEQALKLKPDDARAHGNLGNVLAEKGKLDKAASHYQEALRLQPSLFRIHYRFGLLLLKMDRRAEARDHFTEALKLRPDFPEAQQELLSLTGSVKR